MNENIENEVMENMETEETEDTVTQEETLNEVSPAGGSSLVYLAGGAILGAVGVIGTTLIKKYVVKPVVGKIRNALEKRKASKNPEAESEADAVDVDYEPVDDENENTSED